MNYKYFFAQDSDRYMRGRIPIKYKDEDVMSKIQNALDALEYGKASRMVVISNSLSELNEMEEKCQNGGVQI